MHDIAWRGLYRGERDLATPESNAHPAKMSWGLCERILVHLRELGLLRGGDTVLDFMAGTGRTALIAGAMGYWAITVELEPRFISMQRDNKVYAEQRLGRSLDWVILQGDARNLAGLLTERGLCGVVSPPYADVFCGDSYQAMRDIDRRHRRLDIQGVSWQGRRENKTVGEIAFLGGYGASPGQIGTLPDRGIVAVTSPPYIEGGDIHSVDATTEEIGRRDGKRRGGNMARSHGIYQSPGQIGQLGAVSGESYLSAMAQVYAQAAQVCRILVVVTKNPTRNGKLRLLHKDTYRLLNQVGFKVVDYHRAILFEEENQADLFGGNHRRVRGRMSFFKRLSYYKGSPVARWEDVFFCVRDGDGLVGCTSPPYANESYAGLSASFAEWREMSGRSNTKPGIQGYKDGYGDTPGQIGALRD